MNNIFIASDHGGLELKEQIIKYFQENELQIEDLGAYDYDPEDDYPDFVAPLVKEVQNDPKNKLGILLCRNGVGVAMMANKYHDIRCALSWNPAHAKSARADDNANVLALPADYVDFDDAIQTITTFVLTPFSEADRHIRRLKKVEHFSDLKQ